MQSWSTCQKTLKSKKYVIHGTDSFLTWAGLHLSPRYSMGSKLVEFLLKVVQETMGDYGLPGGPSSAEADEKIYQKMLR